MFNTLDRVSKYKNKDLEKLRVEDITDDIKRQINSRPEVFFILDKYSVEKNKTGKDASYICPVCHNGSGKNKGQGLVLNPNSKNDYSYTCFSSCNESNDVIGWLSKGTNTSYLDTVRYAMDTLNIPFTHRETEKRWVCDYEYRDLEDNLVYVKSRFKEVYKDNGEPTGNKTFSQYTFNGGSKVYNLQSLSNEEKATLYNLKAVNDGIKANKTILILEGEKDVETVKSLGLNDYIPTTYNTATPFNEYHKNQLDKANKIAVIMDNDDIGTKYSNQIYDALNGQIEALKFINWPDDTPKKYDVTDLLEQTYKGNKEKLIDFITDDKNYIDKPKEITVNTTNDNVKKSNKKIPLTHEILEQVLNDNGITVRENIVTKNIEFIGLSYDDTYSEENINSLAVTLIKNNYLLDNFSYCTDTSIENNLRVIADKNRYSPVIEYLEGLPEYHFKPNDDPIGELVFDILNIPKDDDFTKTLVTKWLVQAIAIAYNGVDDNEIVGADGVLVLIGPEGIGKTSFFRELTPIKNMYSELNTSLDMGKKDSVIEATNIWICELGELNSTTKKGQSELKSFITRPKDTYRAPYGRIAETKPRRTVFCATVNNDDFLTGDTGYRRWWTIETLSTIKWEKLKNKDYLNKLWACIYKLYKDGYEWRLGRKNTDILKTRNINHNVQFEGSEEIKMLLDFDIAENERIPLKANQVKDILNRKFFLDTTSVKVGRNLSTLVTLGLIKTSNPNNIKHYHLPLKESIRNDYQDILNR